MSFQQVINTAFRKQGKLFCSNHGNTLLRTQASNIHLSNGMASMSWMMSRVERKTKLLNRTEDLECSVAPAPTLCMHPNNNGHHTKQQTQQRRYFSSDTTSAEKTRTFVVGIDGTTFSFDGLRRAFECANKNDTIYPLHFPASLESLEVELMLFGPNAKSASVQSIFADLSDIREKTTKSIADQCNDIRAVMDVNSEVNFEIKIADPSPSAKHDLVRACFDFRADTLVLGCRGIAHSLKDTLIKEWKDHVGSVPDYCLHHAPCDVLIVKPAEY